jgi:hypothetical protein
VDVLDKIMLENFALGRPPADAVESWDNYDENGIDLAALEDVETRSGNGMQDDPPPPEEEDKPDDGHEESGGTGTEMALEEGKMGKKDSDRAEGQYKMQKNQEDPQLARQQAIEQARAAGILGSTALKQGGGGVGLGLGDGRPNEDGTPSRVAKVEGEIAETGMFDRLRAMIFIAPTEKATKLIDLVHETGGAIAVSYNGKIRPLRLQFDYRDSSVASEYWLEARVTTKGLVIEAVPDKPLEVTDMKELAATLAKAREARGADAKSPVDVLVDADVTAQRLIDVTVALDVAGVRVIGMGEMPKDEELKRRGHRIPSTHVGQPNAQGDLDKKEIRKVVKANLSKITACYEKALATNPNLGGTVSAQFFITPKGTVAASSASGVDPEVANCVAEAIKTFVFPKPGGGGGVQVNYPFTLRP